MEQAVATQNLKNRYPNKEFWQPDFDQEHLDVMRYLCHKYPLSERVSNILDQLPGNNSTVMSERIARGYELHMIGLSLQKYGLSEE